MFDLVRKLLFFIIGAVISCTLYAAKRIVVAQDGSGDFTTVQAAFNAVSTTNKNDITIFVKRGFYKEKLVLEKGKGHVRLVGEDRFATVLTFDDHTGKVAPNGDTINTRTSYSFLMLADNFTAENITFENASGPTGGQAVAVEADGNKAAFKDCRFVGDQDVLFTNNENSSQYYQNCYLEGTTDFIFGSSTVWFEKCHIHSKKNSYVTAASTPKNHLYGYVFNECVLTADTIVKSVALGRPWRPFANVIFIHCYLDRHIRPEGWSNWNNTDNYKTTRYTEYKSYGPGGNSTNRLSWTSQLTDEQAREITIDKVLNGWKPFQN